MTETVIVHVATEDESVGRVYRIEFPDRVNTERWLDSALEHEAVDVEQVSP